jgi:hypothetical protein
MRVFDAPPSATVDVFSLLCSQSGALHGIEIRLRNAGAELAPPGPDGWRGPAESAQATLVHHLLTMVEAACATVESARQHTDAAIRSMNLGE